MAIYTERIIRVNNNQASMDKDIYIYRGNRNIEIQFKVVDHQFKFKDVNLVEQISPSHAYVTLLTPQMLQIGTGKAEVLDGVIKLVINSAMIDEKTECGDYTIVVDLYDEVSDALITIPPIENQLHVLDRMTEIDDVPDELRFIFDEQTGNLEVANIDVTYDETSGEIQTIERIPLKDKTARRLIENIEADNDEQQEMLNSLSSDMQNVKIDVAAIKPIIPILQDNGYSQIKVDMSQEEIQNELNKSGIILVREGEYNLIDSLVISDSTTIIMDKNVKLNGPEEGCALILNNVADVSIYGPSLLNRCYITINDSTDIYISKICIASSDIGINIVGGDNVIIDNVITQECSMYGCSIINHDAFMNVEIRNHVDIQSNSALLVDANTENIDGKIHIINPLYEVSEELSHALLINACNEGPNVIIDNPIFEVNNDKENLIMLSDENSNLGNISINNPIINGSGNINSYIRIDGVGDDNNIVLAINNLVGDINGDIIVREDVCSTYVLNVGAEANSNIDLSGLPKGFECEFINKSPVYFINIQAVSIDNNLNVLQLRNNEYVKMKHIGENKWVIMDENFRNKLITVEQSNYVLSIPNARYVYASIIGEVRIQLPDFLDSFTEIHLFISVSDGGSLVYPEGIKWTNDEPELEVDGVYEFIFTKVRGLWLIGCVTYV